MSQPRPNFKIMWNAFDDVAAPAPPASLTNIEQARKYLIQTLQKIGDTIGGKVKTNFDLGVNDVNENSKVSDSLFPPKPIGFTNGCATRLSYVMNKAGVQIHTDPKWRTVGGGDGKRYIFTVAEMKLFLAATFGKPDIEKTRNPSPKDFALEQGIITFDVHFSDATGHATLWDGTRAVDEDYFYPGRGLVCTSARLWDCP